MKVRRAVILDGYVDEPACFGVPPYIAPHARYVAGVLYEHGVDVTYLTIDEHRRGSAKSKRLASSDLLVVIAGCLVPGKYLRGMPITLREVETITASFAGPSVIAGSSAIYGFGRGGGKAPTGGRGLPQVFQHTARVHADAFLHDLLETGEGRQRKRTMEEWARWCVAGAPIVTQHPDHPGYLIAELDTYHGCVRYVTGGCSFCIEPAEGMPRFRPAEDVAAEVAALAALGVAHFRIGGQACFYCYGAEGVGVTESPTPDPAAIERLLTGVRRAAPTLRMLHIDNVDPAIIAEHPEESEAVTRLVVEHCTDGNIAAFGMETADPLLVAKNNLNADAEQVMFAIEMLNRIGGVRGPGGMPAFLPGLNFLGGLWGERKETYRLNRAFLAEMVERGLMVRRINIRKIASAKPGFETDDVEFRRFKEWVRAEVDHVLLSRVVPVGTVLRRVYLELRDGNLTFGRQPGTYALLVGLPYPLSTERYVDVVVTDHGERSITGVEYPFPVNHRPLAALAGLPGVGKKRAARIAVARPFGSAASFRDALDDPAVADRLLPFVTFEGAGPAC
ncbi:MAG: radical SAM protein [Methanobacteriota archaeon]